MSSCRRSRRCTSVAWDASVGLLVAGFTPLRCEIAGVSYVIQDNTAETQEVYDLRVRTGNAITGPDPTPGGLKISVPLVSPGGTGSIAWQISTVFGTPLTIPCADEWFLGIGLGPAFAWIVDGLGLHSSQHNTGSGDNPRTAYMPTPPSFAWGISPSGVVVHDGPRDWRIGALTGCAVLNVGAIHTGAAPSPNFGVAGMYPDVAKPVRGDGLCFRVTDATNAGGLAFLFFTFPTVPVWASPFSFWTWKGSLWILSPTVPPGGSAVSIPISGEVHISPPCFAPLGPCLPAGFILYFQALTTGPALTPPVRFTNGQMSWL